MNRVGKMFAAAAFGTVSAFAAVWDAEDNGASASASSAHDFQFVSIDGDALPLSTFEGKTLMVVNTASFCGFTDQYTGLQELYERYKDRGFVLLGVPSGDFGNQEYGSNEEIKQFCEMNYSITFPLTRKEVVKGTDSHPFYSWARQTLGAFNAPRWNFHKYLVGPDGNLLDAFGTQTRPTSRQVIRAVEASLQNSS